MCNSRVASEHFGPGKGAQRPAFRKPGGKTEGTVPGPGARTFPPLLALHFPAASKFTASILQEPSDSEWRTESVFRLNFVN